MNSLVVEYYDYIRVIEDWYKDNYGNDFDPVDSEVFHEEVDQSFGLIIEDADLDEGFRFEIVDHNKLMLGRIRYGF
jgi:hypothetical protein